MTRLYSSISVETTLASGINTTQTTLTVPSSAAATALLGGETLAAGNVDIFTVVIDPDTSSEEVVYVTDVSGDTLTISRGQAGTGTAGVSGIAHGAGATIRHVLTSDDLDFFRNGVATANAAIPKSLVNAKGDIVTATADDVPARLAVGTNGQVLKVNSSTATGLEWSSDLGKILQVVTVVQNSGIIFTTTTTPVDTGLSASITPSSTSSKILVINNTNGIYKDNGAAASSLALNLLRGSTVIAGYGGNAAYTNASEINAVGGVGLSILDTPSTTSSITYKTQFGQGFSGVTGNIFINFGAQSSLTLMEVAQ